MTIRPLRLLIAAVSLAAGLSFLATAGGLGGGFIAGVAVMQAVWMSRGAVGP
jgi:hypothetical protein